MICLFNTIDIYSVVKDGSSGELDVNLVNSLMEWAPGAMKQMTVELLSQQVKSNGIPVPIPLPWPLDQIRVKDFVLHIDEQRWELALDFGLEA